VETKGRNRALGKDAVLALIATGSNAAYQWIVLIALAKFSGVDAVGYYALATAVFLPVFRLGSLGQREVAAMNFKEKFDIVGHCRVRCWSSLISGLCCLGILGAAQSGQLVIFSIWSAIRIMEALFDFSAGVFQRHKHYGVLATSSVLRNLVSPLVTAGILASTGHLALAFTVQFTLHVGIFAALDSRRLAQAAAEEDHAGDGGVKHLVEWVKPPDLRELLTRIGKSGELTVALFLAAINTSIPRFIAKGMFGANEVGLIGAMIQVSNTFIPVLTGAAQAAMPRLGMAYAGRNRSEYTRLSLILGAGAVTCALPLIAIAYSPYCSRFLELVLSEEFSKHQSLFQLAAIASVFSYLNVVLGPAALSQGAYRAELFRSGLSFIILVAGGFALGMNSGLKGILTAFVIAQAMRAVWLIVSVTRSKNFDSPPIR